MRTYVRPRTSFIRGIRAAALLGLVVGMAGCGGDGNDSLDEFVAAVEEVDPESAEDVDQLLEDLEAWCAEETDPLDVYVFDLLDEEQADEFCHDEELVP